ncbi:hypothetical protein CUT44_12835 [Streptomyces carminius]|uniref:Lipoprotein n=1 Tax=Streptomyces carminius TaxID=2665496 RepID=A0A2M8M015_9ACTN|nr:hypothetical protein [Streptomyces carminius]PJE97548.1 hypothetical protein CUT44_12835 [Streptomyces carminius]
MVTRRGRRSGAVGAAVLCAGTVLAVLATPATTGCSAPDAAVGAAAGEPAAAEARAAVREAAGVLARSGTSRAHTRVETDSGGTRVVIRGTGAFDYGTRTGLLRVVPPAAPAVPATGADRRRPIVALVTPGALYLRNRGAGVPAGKWVRVDAATLPDGNLVTGGATDPITAAELLRGARSVSFRGEERLHGETVRHYRGTVDLAAAARAARPPWRGRLAAAVAGLSRRTVPFDAYVDGRGRLRKIRQHFALPSAAGGPGGSGGAGGAVRQEVSVVSTTTLYGFGVPVEIALPGPGDIHTGRIAAP